MSIKSNLVNRDPELHLRDAQHARRFYTENGHLFSPKVKFLYHVVFEISGEHAATVSNKYSKEISVLVKMCDLPQFRINVDTRKQYNRNKNFQTGINYEEVKIVFHDDSYGVTTALLEDYYRYYYRDGNKNKGTPGSYTDFGNFSPYQYREKLPRYGLDFLYATGPRGHFFKKIIIYQMALQQWTSYTLVNPLVTSFGHDTLDYSDGSGIMENTLSIAYEAVMYNRGNVGDDSEPTGFADPGAGYDVTPSPLVLSDPGSVRRTSTLGQVAESLKNISNTELAFGTTPNQDAIGLFDNPQLLANQIVAQQFENEAGGVQGITVPNPDTQDVSLVRKLVATTPSVEYSTGQTAAQFRSGDYAGMASFLPDYQTKYRIIEIYTNPSSPTDIEEFNKIFERNPIVKVINLDTVPPGQLRLVKHLK